MSRSFAAALSTFLALSMSACPPSRSDGSDDGSVDGSDDGNDDVVVDDADVCALDEKSRGPSESCCLAFGADACGATLFCAAFDGRTVPTCYVEKTRLDGEECGADVHCASGACADSGVCRGSPGQPCTRDAGCAAFQGTTYVCVDNDNGDQCLPAARTLGGACVDDGGCDSGFCADDRCVSGDDGARCAGDDDCQSGRCIGDVCASGTIDSVCAVDDDCASDLTCRNARCGPRQLGDSCAEDDDCVVVFGGCFGGTCVSQAAGDACDSDAECGVNSCVDGRCEQVCTDSLRCALIGAFAGVVQECREGSCVVVGGLGEPCSTEPDCASETLGLTCASNVCRKIEGFPCSASTDCASGLCAPVVRDRCVDAAGDIRTTCDATGDCPQDQSCLPRVSDECVAG